MRTLAASLLACLLGTAVPAQDVWVDPVNGIDTNPGNATLPVKTLTQASTMAGLNSTIFLLPGTYGPNANGEVLPIRIGSGGPQDNLVIRGIGGVVFDIAQTIGSVLYFDPGAPNARLTNITFTNSDTTDWWTRVINSGGGDGIEIDRCIFLNVNRGIVLWTTDNPQGWKIHNNIFSNLANDAILEYAGTNEVFNNTFVTGTWKAYISDSMDSVCFNNLIVGYNIAFENNNGANIIARYQNNWVYQTATITQGVGFANPLPASNTVGVDPLLVNTAMGDYHPTTASPLIEAGNANLPNVRADVDGNSGMVDYNLDGLLLPDIGAYELSPIALTATYDTTTRILNVGVTSSAPGLAAFLLFSFDAGLVRLPNQPPILLDQNRYLGALSGGFPQTWPISLANIPPFAAGTRIVMQVLGFRPGIPIVAGNQVWVQL